MYDPQAWKDIQREVYPSRVRSPVPCLPYVHIRQQILLIHLFAAFEISNGVEAQEAENVGTVKRPGQRVTKFTPSLYFATLQEPFSDMVFEMASQSFLSDAVRSSISRLQHSHNLHRIYGVAKHKQQ